MWRETELILPSNMLFKVTIEHAAGIKETRVYFARAGRSPRLYHPTFSSTERLERVLKDRKNDLIIGEYFINAIYWLYS